MRELKTSGSKGPPLMEREWEDVQNAKTPGALAEAQSPGFGGVRGGATQAA